MRNKTIKEIKKIAQRINALLDQQAKSLSQKVDYIIVNKIKDQNTIEHTLDWLLDCCHMGKGKREFKKLNKYYGTIRPRSSKIYDGYYKEATEE